MIAADAWRRTADLCDEQADQLESALRRLAERWPVSQPASLAFQTWARTLVASMRTSASVATNNGSVVANVTGELAVTVNAIARLKGQATHHLRLEDDRRNAPTSYVGVSEYDGPMPPDNWRHDLDQQAREIMRRSEALIVAEAARVQDVAAFRVDIDPTDGIDIGGDDRATHPNPRFDPGSWPAWPTLATTASSQQASPDVPHGDDPVLDGTTGTTADGTYGVLGRGSEANAARIGATFVETPVGHALAPGGIIGGNRPIDGFGSGPQRSAPTANATARTSASPAMVPMVPPMAGARSGQSGGAAGGQSVGGQRRRGGRDDEWVVPQGGPAVIEPRPDPIQHDPGPGVIGLDR